MRYWSTAGKRSLAIGLRSLALALRHAWVGDPAIPANITIGERVYIGRGVNLDWRFGHLISVGDDSTIVNGTRILCHDASSNRRLGVTWCAPVRIGCGVYVGADSLILPGVTIGDDAIVAAGAVVTGDVAAGTVVAGVPARPISTTPEIDERRRASLGSSRVFGSAYAGKNLTPDMVRELREAGVEGGYFLGKVKAETRP
jgi:maltose O-acetyltransferase